MKLEKTIRKINEACDRLQKEYDDIQLQIEELEFERERIRTEIVHHDDAVISLRMIKRD